MYWLTDWSNALGWLRPSRSERDHPESDGEPAATGRVRARVQRLLEMQEERHQLERLTTVLSDAIPGCADGLIPVLPPSWQEHVMEIETEIEHLGQEIVLEEAQTEAVHPHASEAVGQCILQQIESRRREAERLAGLLPECWPETDAGYSHVGTRYEQSGE